MYQWFASGVIVTAGLGWYGYLWFQSKTPSKWVSRLGLHVSILTSVGLFSGIILPHTHVTVTLIVVCGLITLLTMVKVQEIEYQLRLKEILANPSREARIEAFTDLFGRQILRDARVYGLYFGVYASDVPADLLNDPNFLTEFNRKLKFYWLEAKLVYKSGKPYFKVRSVPQK